jgi:uncharacterized membrane protein
MQKDRVMLGSTEVILAQDRFAPSDWRVEYFDDNGCCYVTVFAGPAAGARARVYFDALKNGKIEVVCVKKAGSRIAS